MVYSRSTDGGQTWDKKHTVFPGFDSTLTSNGGADQYAIDVKGNTVAVVNGDLLQGVVVFKSSDNGDNWTRIMADSFPYAPWSDKKLMLDTPLTNDGSVDVLIDDNGKLHVFWGLGRVFNDDTTDGSYSFYPGLQGIVHWSEATGKSQIISSGASFDRTGDGISSLDQSTYAALSSGNVPSGLNTVARLGNTSAMRQPVSSIGTDGTIYYSLFPWNKIFLIWVPTSVTLGLCIQLTVVLHGVQNRTSLSVCSAKTTSQRWLVRPIISYT